MEVCLKSLSLLGPVMVALMLSACGGGGGDTPPATSGGGGGGNNSGGQEPAAKLNSKAQVIEYHGDSTVWGYRAETSGERVETPAPTAFDNALENRHTVNNMGLNRSTACDLLEGTGGYQQNWQDYMAASDATVVIINHGINDMSSYDTARYRSCLNQLVDIAQSADKIVILETPNPVVDASDNRRIIDYVETMRDVAEQQGVYLIDQYAELQEEFAANPTEVCPDGVHPSEEVYIEKGQFAAAEFATFDEPQ
jgi:lysophospholipase L1-like esterase